MTFKKENVTACNELPAQLPITRLKISDPFLVTGIDYAGPFTIMVHQPQMGKFVLDLDEEPENSQNKKKKKSKKKQEGLVETVYILIFTCAITREIHLETVKDLSITAFINA